MKLPLSAYSIVNAFASYRFKRRKCTFVVLITLFLPSLILYRSYKSSCAAVTLGASRLRHHLQHQVVEGKDLSMFRAEEVLFTFLAKNKVARSDA